jgi:hypothetical protein
MDVIMKTREDKLVRGKMTKIKTIFEVERISTSEHAKRYEKLFREKKTYFLNGKWGSGKTEFLKEIEKYSENKFIYLDLWNVKDNRTVIQIGMHKLHPLLFRIFNVLGFCSIVVALLSVPAVNVGFVAYIPDWPLLKLISMIIAFIYTIWQIYKWTTDEILVRILPYVPLAKLSSFWKIGTWFYEHNLENKTLVIDDFDRVNVVKQEEAYKLFNVLNGKLPIIFVGDFSKITKNEDNYLQKIIDQKLSLPYVLHSTQIINNLDFPRTISELFVKEERTIRELHHFVNYANFEMRDKKGRVQLEQQLILIYVYLFYPQKYEELVQGPIPVVTETSPKFVSGNAFRGISQEAEQSPSIDEIVEGILESKEVSPPDFSHNPRAYFVYEQATNLSMRELMDILENDEVLQMFLECDSHEIDNLKQKDKYEELEYFLRNTDLYLWKKQAARIEKLAIQQFISQNDRRIFPNSLTRLVFKKKIEVLEDDIREGTGFFKFKVGNENSFSKYMETKISNNDYELGTTFIFGEVNDFLNDNDMDLSQKIYWYTHCLDLRGRTYYQGTTTMRDTPRINEEKLASCFEKEASRSVSDELYLQLFFPEQPLHIVCGLSLDAGKLNEYRNQIESLADKNYQLFWEYYYIEPVEDGEGETLREGGPIQERNPEWHEQILQRLINIKNHCNKLC